MYIAMIKKVHTSKYVTSHLPVDWGLYCTCGHMTNYVYQLAIGQQTTLPNVLRVDKIHN